MLRRLIVFIAASLAAACTAPTDPGDGIILETAGTEFEWSQDALAISYTVSNVGTDTAYLSACEGYPLVAADRRTNNAWVEGGHACLAVLSAVKIAVVPGETVAFVAHLFFLDPGTYRLRLGISTSSAILDRPRTSNVFSVR